MVFELILNNSKQRLYIEVTFNIKIQNEFLSHNQPLDLKEM